MNTSESLQNIVDTFSILHDGRIVEWSGNKKKLILKIDCQYLAELIDESFEFFYVELNDILKIQLEAWMNPINLPQKTFKDLNQIFKAELEILSTEKSVGEIIVTCNQHNTQHDFCGGKLVIKCSNLTIKAQDGRVMTVEELDELSNTYWEKNAF